MKIRMLIYSGLQKVNRYFYGTLDIPFFYLPISCNKSDNFFSKSPIVPVLATT